MPALAVAHLAGMARSELILGLGLYLVAAGIRIVRSLADAYWARRLVMGLARFTDPILLATSGAMAVLCRRASDRNDTAQHPAVGAPELPKTVRFRPSELGRRRVSTL